MTAGNLLTFMSNLVLLPNYQLGLFQSGIFKQHWNQSILSATHSTSS